MVRSLDSSKRRADSTPHSAPHPPVMKLEVEEPLDEKHVRLYKRVRDVSTSYEQALYNNVLGELGLLGKTLCFTSSKGSEVGEQSDFSTSSSSLSKIKALNFPSSLLMIGTWECVSRYEGDLVAKCYLAKHKLVWEVLEGGFKSKIEFYWSDITAIKAVFFEADSTPHSAPPPPAMRLEVEEPLDEKHVRLHKRVRDVSTSYEQALYNNVLGESGPLGLRPRKSPSLADMI
ncbi:hypothetical protein ZIOFF_043802 [Zingiber officinale]|uniref:TRF2/HOY1 PH-like domain-containing protein n=1 Tax=Zingiber officinale TaxID=94328 RepID=A0A8J5FU14_ZINOF|nr:hypothetical protein ZIOFF_043802 [Zingiber officinale]